MLGKKYDRQFKLTAARLVLSQDISVEEISDDLEVSDNMLRRWASEYEKYGETAFPSNGTPRVNKYYDVYRKDFSDKWGC